MVYRLYHVIDHIYFAFNVYFPEKHKIINFVTVSNAFFNKIDNSQTVV